MCPWIRTLLPTVGRKIHILSSIRRNRLPASRAGLVNSRNERSVPSDHERSSKRRSSPSRYLMIIAARIFALAIIMFWSIRRSISAGAGWAAAGPAPNATTTLASVKRRVACVIRGAPPPAAA
jgi:hypothetical protein